MSREKGTGNRLQGTVLVLLVFFCSLLVTRHSSLSFAPQMGIAWPAPGVRQSASGISLLSGGHAYCHGSNCATSAINLQQSTSPGGG
jgi:hypothetical protein